jgi:hypothetical protein
MKAQNWINLVNLLAIILIGIGEIVLGVRMLNLEIASKRADISILIDPARNQNWTFVPNGVYLTVNGTFCNEGTRTAIIKELELSMIYRLSDDQYIVTRTYSDPARVCNWNNNTITEDELRPFSLTMYVDRYTILDSRIGQTVNIGNSRSDEFGLSITYYDGLSDTKSEQIFSTKS